MEPWRAGGGALSPITVMFELLVIWTSMLRCRKITQNVYRGSFKNLDFVPLRFHPRYL